MFKIHEIRELIRIVDQSNVNEFTLEHEGSKLSLKKQTGQVVTTVAAPQVQQVVPTEQPTVQEVKETNNQTKAATADKNEVEDKNIYQIKSPMVGTFYRAPSPDADPYVKAGDIITEETIVCIVEAMKLFNEIEAEVKGEIVEILVENGQLVEYGQPLFLVKVK